MQIKEKLLSSFILMFQRKMGVHRTCSEKKFVLQFNSPLNATDNEVSKA